MTTRAQRRRELFAAAYDLPAERRAGFLAGECPDAELRREVAELLAVAPPVGFLEPPELGTSSGVPDRCGRFTRLRPLPERGADCHLGQDQTTLQLVELRLAPLAGRDAETAVAQWVRTVLAQERLASPHLPRAEGHGTCSGPHGDWVWVATAFVPGDGCDDGAATDSTEHCLGLLHGLATLLAAAHRVGVAHGELGPGMVVQPTDGPFQLVGLGWRAVAAGGEHAAADQRAFAALLALAADRLAPGPAAAGLRELQRRCGADPAADLAAVAEGLAALCAGRPLPPPPARPQARRWWPWFRGGHRVARGAAEPPR